MFYSTAGRYCEWQHNTIDNSDKIETFEEFKKTLHLFCEPGEPAYLNWTVAEDTPDLVYYQCFTHNFLGWKIHVVDPGTKIANISGANNQNTHSSTLLGATLIIFVGFYWLTQHIIV